MRLMIGKNNVNVEVFKAYKIHTLGIPVPGLSMDVICRLHETDPEVFNQVFIREEYRTEFLPADAKVIIDAGANVGYSVLFFKLLYPTALVIAIEPDPRNFEMLLKNCGHLEGVILLNAALWKDCSKLELKFTSSTGNKLGSWGTRTVSISENSDGFLTEAFDIPTLMNKYDINAIDICKIDIEGAEKEVFGEINQPWYVNVDLFILETHERIVPGSDSAVKTALPVCNWEYAKKGENLFFRKKGS